MIRSASQRVVFARSYHTRKCFGHRRKVPNSFHPPPPRFKGDPRLQALADAYRDQGHLDANLDPLGLQNPAPPCSLEPSLFGLRESEYVVQEILPGFPTARGSVEEVVAYLRHMYCGTMSLEAAHVSDVEERQWLVEHYESNRDKELNKETKLRLAGHLMQSQTFDNFLAKKFNALKRYGAEGAESMMAFFDQVLASCPDHDIEEVVIGMPHRGRLNLLIGMLQFSKETFFHKLLGNAEFLAGAPSTGDVVSHLVSSVDLEVEGRKVHFTMLPNPSHLEAVNPVALGKVRARQLSLREGPYSEAPEPPDVTPHAKVLSVQVHGDAAFSAQGVVTESLGLANLPHFDVGGTVHLIVNNQLGFTTEMDHGRSSHHCSDVVKAINAPIIHVNGSNPEEVAKATGIALAYRDHFQKDILVNMTCYRRWGHNELDNPSLTQPLMYDVIEKETSVPDKYSNVLENEGVVSRESLVASSKDYFDSLGKTLKISDTFHPSQSHLLNHWKSMKDPSTVQTSWDTGCPIDLLKFVGKKSVAVPSDIVVNQRLKKSHIEERVRKLKAGRDIDWATAEALAMGTLLLQGFNVRLSGQDVGRGTFSHRHVMLVCQSTDTAVIPFNHMLPHQKNFLEVVNSPLSEEAVLGFEYGFSTESPQHLVLWEAQFGDFFNGAQVIIDTFVSCGEAKWLLQSGLVLLLPHGYDGAGPDHSSSQVERFLQQCDSSEAGQDGDSVNMHVVYPTTPAQYYHLLRRQVVRNFRKPLIVLSPKILLRLPAATSSITDMAPGTTFLPVLTDERVNPNEVRKVIFCSGKHYYALDSYRQEKKITDTAIVRVELLCPFPSGHIYKELMKYRNATEWIWSQEEPMNKGPWTFVQPRFIQQLGCKLALVSRKPYAASAVGVASVHLEEADKLISDTFR